MQTPTETKRAQHLQLPQSLPPGLALLVQAREYADDVERDRWEFAVEIQTLRAAGLTNSDFRWLVCRGYLEHAREMTGPGDRRREFRGGGELIFTKRTCFVLTEAGLEFARSLCRLPASKPARAQPGSRNQRRTNERAPKNGSAAEPPNGSAARRASDGAGELRPQWDGERHEFRLGGRVVKTFKVPSPNQETILTAFEEEGWPRRIDDPLPQAHSIDPKQRLHDTIKSLNRNQKNRLISFQGDGSGQGICWEPLSDTKRRR